MLVRHRFLSSPPQPFSVQLGRGLFALVSREDFSNLSQYSWFAKRSGVTIYAVRKVRSNNKTYLVRMHRQVMHTPRGMVTHHMNGNSLDNRRENLLNCYPWQHNFFH